MFVALVVSLFFRCIWPSGKVQGSCSKPFPPDNGLSMDLTIPLFVIFEMFIN